MIHDLKITALIDNKDNPQKNNLHTEHGLSFWIEADDIKILFDTGRSDLLMHNAKVLDIDISKADYLILSHGHYDHTGGVTACINTNRTMSVICHADIYISRYSRQPDSSMKYIGISEENSQALNQNKNRITLIDTPYFINDNIGITGPIPRIKRYENTGGHFYRYIKGIAKDLIIDDLAIWIKTEKGLCIITGCCHSGIVNTLSYINKLEPHQPIIAILGGFHLLNASNERLKNTAKYLNSCQPEQFHAFHCTGNRAIDFLCNTCTFNISQGFTGMTTQIGA
jgi:7,8-dihydropterin-6-yl-methyl-4-(beta-D-ribofuranosyl)aminobenzene 5'-phosphate synthase